MEAGGDGDQWEDVEAAEGGDGWETSNEELPGGQPGGQPGDQETAEASGEQAGGPPGGKPGDRALEKALEDFDGEILAEQEVISARSNEHAGERPGPAPMPGSTPGSDAEAGATDAESSDGPVFSSSGRQMPSAPAPPAQTGSVPEDIPDATDDDVIARQLREAAMQETDPELKEKLWEEYRRYKGG